MKEKINKNPQAKMFDEIKINLELIAQCNSNLNSGEGMQIIEEQLSKFDLSSLINKEYSRLSKLEKTKNILLKDLLNLKNYSQ